MSKPLHDHSVVLRMREVIKNIAEDRIRKLRPEDRYATIVSIDWTNMRATVQHAAGVNTVTVPFPANCQPTDVDQLVRISGGRGNRYISAVLSAPSWHALTLTNSWVAVGGTWAAPSYSRDFSGRVRLAGLIKNGAVGSSAATLPAGFRPVVDRLYTSTQGSDTATARIDVKADGTIVPQSTITNTNHISLDGISFETY